MNVRRTLASTALAIFALCPSSALTKGERSHLTIQPLRASLTYAPTGQTLAQSTYVRSRSGKNAYILWLSPERDVNKHVVGIDLVLNKAPNRDWDSNFAEPTSELAWSAALQFRRK